MVLFGSASAVASPAPKAEMEIGAHHSPALRMVHGGVEVSIDGDARQTLEVYALTGRLVASVPLNPGEPTLVELPSGFYILKIGKFSSRIAIR